ncbi:MAG: hypothetical protein CL724_11715 [Chloroflexi bacterium]|jgi:uncharacterized membrane-anchored protein YhcB (DUF1043 family)|nr:hypothetical protein [Chloroflexota bacterium]
MTEAWALVVAAVVTGVFGLFGVFIRNFRHENQRDHAVVADKLTGMSRDLDAIKASVDSNGAKLDDHLEWHKTPKRDARKKAAAKKATAKK